MELTFSLSIIFINVNARFIYFRFFEGAKIRKSILYNVKKQIVLNFL